MGFHFIKTTTDPHCLVPFDLLTLYPIILTSFLCLPWVYFLFGFYTISTLLLNCQICYKLLININTIIIVVISAFYYIWLPLFNQSTTITISCLFLILIIVYFQYFSVSAYNIYNWLVIYVNIFTGSYTLLQGIYLQ